MSQRIHNISGAAARSRTSNSKSPRLKKTSRKEEEGDVHLFRIDHGDDGACLLPPLNEDKDTNGQTNQWNCTNDDPCETPR
jgi:hypothetical protein